MEALVNEIIEKTGLTRDQAMMAARITVDYIKDRVPSDTASQIDGVLTRESVEETAKSIAGKIEGVFKR